MGKNGLDKRKKKSFAGGGLRLFFYLVVYLGDKARDPKDKQALVETKFKISPSLISI